MILKRRTEIKFECYQAVSVRYYFYFPMAELKNAFGTAMRIKQHEVYYNMDGSPSGVSDL